MGNFSLVAVLTEVVILREAKSLCRLQADAGAEILHSAQSDRCRRKRRYCRNQDSAQLKPLQVLYARR
jgi:hypothetical protein